MMLISNGICQYERRYAALKKNKQKFLGPAPSAISKALVFSPENALGDGPAYLMFSSGFTDKG